MRISLVVVVALLTVGSLSSTGASDVTQRANRRLMSASQQPTPTPPTADKKQQPQKQQPPATPQTNAQQPVKPAQPAQPATTTTPSATMPSTIPVLPITIPAAAGGGQEEGDDEEPAVVLVVPVDEAGEGEGGEDGDDDDDIVTAAGGAGVAEAGPGSDDEDDGAATGADDGSEEEGEQEAGPGGNGEPCDDGPMAPGQAEPGLNPAGPAGAGGPRCVTLDGNSLPNGRLCTAQLVTVTTPTCKDYSTKCLKTSSQLLVPAGTAVDNPADFNLSVQAACKLLGYAAVGSGSVHMSGTSPAAQQLCYNGQDWATGNWWKVLVCCSA